MPLTAPVPGALGELLNSDCVLASAYLLAGQGYIFVAPEDSPLIIEDDEGRALRPGYHVTAQEGWMNDPNGLFEYGNNTHILYQARLARLS